MVETELLNMGSRALKTLATNQVAKSYVLGNEYLYTILRKAADRYLGGETLEETLNKAVVTNGDGFKSSIEFMGENISEEIKAVTATEEFIRICESIGSLKLNSTVSLDLSHIGLDVSKDLCLDNLLKICAAASIYGIEVNLSAEATHQTDHVLNMYKRACDLTNRLGQNVLAITLQAYLYRTRDDFNEIKKMPGRIRVVKGAFATDEKLSMKRGSKLNDAYMSYVDQLLQIGHKCSVATHDHIIQQEAKKLIDHYRPERHLYEFECLHGIQQANLKQLKEEGYMTKIYYVYGKEWYLYLCNRLSEYPLNLFRALEDMISVN